MMKALLPQPPSQDAFGMLQGWSGSELRKSRPSHIRHSRYVHCGMLFTLSLLLPPQVCQIRSNLGRYYWRFQIVVCQPKPYSKPALDNVSPIYFFSSSIFLLIHKWFAPANLTRTHLEDQISLFV